MYNFYNGFHGVHVSRFYIYSMNTFLYLCFVYVNWNNCTIENPSILASSCVVGCN